MLKQFFLMTAFLVVFTSMAMALPAEQKTFFPPAVTQTTMVCMTLDNMLFYMDKNGFEILMAGVEGPTIQTLIWHKPETKEVVVVKNFATSKGMQSCFVSVMHNLQTVKPKGQQS